MEKFNYANRNNILQWLVLIFTGVVIIFFFYFIFIIIIDKKEFMYELLIPLIGVIIMFLMVFNKMFLSKIYITENYIEYKSPFTKVKINKDRIKGIDLIKRRKNRAPNYLSLNEKPAFNIGNYYLIIRKTHYKPDSAFFLLFNPVEETYITAEYRSELFDKLKEYNYI